MMNRKARFVLSSFVLAGMVGGTAAWASSGTAITLQVDGQQRHVHTAAKTVGSALSDLGIEAGVHDIIAPELSTPLANGITIVVRHGHEIQLTIDGKSRDLWVNAASVDEALNQLGFDDRSAVSVSRSMRLDTGINALSVSTPKPVTFKVGGHVVRATVAGPTVAEAAKQANIFLGEADLTSAPRLSVIHRNEVITIQRGTISELTRTEVVASPVVRQKDSSAWQGTEKVVQTGTPGRARVTYEVLSADGKFHSRHAKKTVVLVKATPTIIKIGTKPVPWLDGLSADDPRAIAGAMLLDRGWGPDEYSCLDSLWTKESGWRTDAYNPSGAYGIPQSLPGDKMASVGSDWQTSARTQITWGLNYITGVYGDPCSAWGHSQAMNWY